MSSEPLKTPETDEETMENSSVQTEPGEDSTSRSEPVAHNHTEPGTEHEARIAELTQRIAELEREKTEREREDAIAALVQKYSYLTPDILRPFGNLPLAELDQHASALNAAIHEREHPRDRMGRGGLDPTQPAGRREDVLAVLSEHPDAERLVMTEFRIWDERRSFPEDYDHAYGRYLLMLAKAARGRAISAWLESLGFKISLERVHQWAAFLPSLQDDQGRTFDDLRYH